MPPKCNKKTSFLPKVTTTNSKIQSKSPKSKVITTLPEVVKNVEKVHESSVNENELAISKTLALYNALKECEDEEVVLNETEDGVISITKDTTKIKICSVIVNSYIIPEFLSSLIISAINEEIEAEQVAKKYKENGNVVLNYEMYNEEFLIVNGIITADVIDEEYCLSYAMPGCKIRLSKLENRARLEIEETGNYKGTTMIESPAGTFHGLEKDNTYYVFVEQEEAQVKRDQMEMALIALTMEGASEKNAPPPLISPSDGRVMEGCSCIYGNPCLDEYACRDWKNRFSIAEKNGWKGFI